MMSDPPIEAVLFDFAGTLFDDRSLRDVHLAQLRFVATSAGLAEKSDDDLRNAYRTGMSIAYRTTAGRAFYMHRTLFAGAFVAMAVALGGSIDDATAQCAVDRQYQATIEAATLRADCADTLVALRNAGRRVVIVSNIDDEQLRPMLDRLGLCAMIDAAISSESAGSCKPDATIYDLALRTAAVRADQALFVGDSIGHDVVGPAARGMRTAWLAPHATAIAGDARPDAVIASLAEVLDLVGITMGNEIRVDVGATR